MYQIVPQIDRKSKGPFPTFGSEGVETIFGTNVWALSELFSSDCGPSVCTPLAETLDCVRGISSAFFAVQECALLEYYVFLVMSRRLDIYCSVLRTNFAFRKFFDCVYSLHV